MPTQYRLEAENLEELRERMEREFGPSARIASAERVSQGGFGRFMARRYIEAIIEVPDDASAVAPAPAVLRRAVKRAAEVRAAIAPATPAQAVKPPPVKQPAAKQSAVKPPTVKPPAAAKPAARSAAGAPEAPRVTKVPVAGPGSGMGALLERADAQEELLATPSGGRGGPAGGAAAASRNEAEGRKARAGEFMRLLDGESFNFDPASGARTGNTAAGGASPDPVSSGTVPSRSVPSALGSHRDLLPTPLDGAGDLVVVVGLWGDGVVAGAQLGAESAMRRQAGELAPKFDTGTTAREPITDRRGVLKARAAAVEGQVPLVVSVAVNPLLQLREQMELLDTLGADQLWVAVDAGRKSEDTETWVRHVAARHRVYAVVALHCNETLSPESVLELGFPVFDVTAPTP